MAISHTEQDLLQVVLYQGLRQFTSIANGVQKLSHVCIAVLLYEIDVVVSHDSVLQRHYVWMLKLHQDRDFSDSRGRYSIVAIVNMSPLDCILFLCLTVHASIDCAIGSLSQLIHPIVLVQLVILSNLLLLLLLLSRLLLLLIFLRTCCLRHYLRLVLNITN